MLGVHVFNVGQGDSILLEFPDGSWGVVDCHNDDPDSEPSALEFLKEKRIKRLAFVCLTHLHVDHYSGLPAILDHFGDQIGEYWMPRLEATHWEKYLLVQQNAATTPRRRRDFELLRTVFVDIAKKQKLGRVHYLTANVRLLKFGDVEIDCLAPHAREVGPYSERLARFLKFPSEYKADENRLSVVLRLKYGQSTVILGGDARSSSWIDMWNDAKRRSDSISANLVKISHHGSVEGYSERVWPDINKPGLTHGAISAGSRYGHPDRKVVAELSKMRIRLHCTNYASHCLQSDGSDYSKLEGLEPSVQLSLLMFDQSPSGSPVPCDGDLHFRIRDDGTAEFEHQFPGFCPFHTPMPIAAAQ